mgnify:CR=1 FL=1
MNNLTTIRRYYHQRAKMNLWRDGIYELLIGTGLVIYSIVSYMLDTTIFKSVDPSWQVISIAVFVALGLFCYHMAQDMLKTRITYPRTGFVQLRQPDEHWSLPKIVGLLLLLPVVALFGVLLAIGGLYAITWFGVTNPLWLIVILFSAIFARLGWQTRIQRFGFHTFGVLIIGSMLSVGGVSGLGGLYALIAISGLLMLLSGMIVLAIYLHQHPLEEA